MINMKKIILLVLVLVVAGNVIAWNTNPLYDPFEIMWNAIYALQGITGNVPENNFKELFGVEFTDIMQFRFCAYDFKFYVDSVEEGDVIGFFAKEGISDKYEYYVAVNGTSLDDKLGHNAKVQYYRSGKETWFYGWISDITKNDNMYIVKISPELDYLHYNVGYKIFQNEKIPDVVNTLLTGEINTSHYMVELDDSYYNREYLVQYGESEFNFMNRIMEEEGLFFFHKVDDTIEKLIITDHNPSEINASLNYYGYKVIRGLGEEYVRVFKNKSKMVIGNKSIDSFNFKFPSTNLYRSDFGSGIGNHFEFIPQIPTLDYADWLVGIYHEELQADRNVFLGESTFPLRAGMAVNINGSDYLITEVMHGAYKPSCYMYGNMFKAIPLDIPYRPLRKTPKPRAELDSAIVTGPSGLDNYSDMYGRVKVQFHWDLNGNYDETSSAWIRVANPYAGTSYGMMFIPRIGTEVVVDFEEGDPDHPIIIGSVYNADNMPPVIPEDPGPCIVKKVSKSLGAGSWGWTYVACPAGYKAIACGSYTPSSYTRETMAGYIGSTPDEGDVPDRCLVAWVNEGGSTKTVYGYATCCPEEKI